MNQKQKPNKKAGNIGGLYVDKYRLIRLRTTVSEGLFFSPLYSHYKTAIKADQKSSF